MHIRLFAGWLTVILGLFSAAHVEAQTSNCAAVRQTRAIARQAGLDAPNLASLSTLAAELAALVVVSLTPHALSHRLSSKIATIFLLSVVIFSGSLYLLVLTNQRWLGAITPLGGSGFIFGWFLLAFALRRNASSL